MNSTSYLFVVLAFVLVGSGCLSKEPVAKDTPAPIATSHPRIRVESIANPQLTPTSREGDKTGPVYSSNIIAVYVDTNGVDTPNTTWKVSENNQ